VAFALARVGRLRNMLALTLALTRPIIRPRSPVPVAFEPFDPMPMVAGAAAASILAVVALRTRLPVELDGLERASMQRKAGLASLSSPPSPASWPLTPEGQTLRELLNDSTEFDASWSRLVRTLGPMAEEAATGSSSSLSERVAEVQALARNRAVLVDVLTTRVEADVLLDRLRLLPSVAAIAPDASLPDDAPTLARTLQLFPGQSASQVQTFVSEASPFNDPSMRGRFDRLQAAQLYMGCIQFGYFVSQIFRGQLFLNDETMLTAAEAQQIKARIEEAAQQMRSEVAWAAASRRAASFFELPSEDAPGAEGGGAALGGVGQALGYEPLRMFSKGVQVVGGAQQSEFFATEDEVAAAAAAASEAAEEAADEDKAAEPEPAAAALLPTAEFVPFNAAGLQCALSEACLFGWHLWGAELRAEAELGEGGAEALLTPQERTAYDVS